MSSASAPEPAAGAQPAPVPSGPQTPRPKRAKHGQAKFWLSGVLLLAIAALTGYYLKPAFVANKEGKGPAVATRTAPIVAGDLEQTIRLSGVVQAERFAALMAPQLRGSRSGRGRDGSGGGGGSGSTPMSTAGGIAASNNSSSGSSSGAVGTSGSGSGGDVVPSTSSLGPSRGSTNRFSGSSSSGARSSGGSRSSGGGAVSSGGSSGGSGGSGGSRGGGGGGESSGGGMSTGGMGGGGMRGGGMGGGMGGEFSLVLLRSAAPGSFVKKGDVVAEFDRQYMLLRLDDYRASVDGMRLNLGKLKADLASTKEAHNQVLRIAKADLEQTLLDLKTVEVRSAIESERFRLAVDEAQARHKQIAAEVALFDASQRSQLRAAEIDYAQAQIELRRSEANVDRMVLKAPLDGLVVMQTIYRGGEFGQIREGDQIPSGMFFMSIVDPRSMVVNATVNQADSESLRLNLKARVRFDAYNDLQLPATVIGLGAMTKPAGWRGTYVREIPVRLKLDAMDPRVIPDLSASADVLLASERQAVLAPRAAIFHDGPGGSPFVFLRGPQGWTRRPVEVGLVNHVAAAVRSGVRQGDVVAVERPVS